MIDKQSTYNGKQQQNNNISNLSMDGEDIMEKKTSTHKHTHRKIQRGVCLFILYVLSRPEQDTISFSV